ncbi:MAG: low-complexity tail membrane protein [Cyanobacteria bacterium P01_D01_bin.123]
MPKSWDEPFLWLHAAAVVLVPLGIAIAQLGLAAGDPWLWPPLEVSLVAALGLGPVMWLQGLQPIYPFSVGIWHLPPRQLSRSRRRRLRGLFGSSWLQLNQQQWLTVLLALLLLFVLIRMYWSAPLWSALTFVHLGWLTHPTGLLVASAGLAVAALALNLHVTALRALVASDRDLNTLVPMSRIEIEQSFFTMGKPKADLWKAWWPQTERRSRSRKSSRSDNAAARVSPG